MILAGSVPVYGGSASAEEATEVSREEAARQESTETPESPEEAGTAGQESMETTESTGEDKTAEQESKETLESTGEDKTAGQESTETPESTEEAGTAGQENTETIEVSEEEEALDSSLQRIAIGGEEDVYAVPDAPPAFQAHIEYGMGYTVIGTFTDFTPDIVRIDTLYSLDGESWRAVTGGDWNLHNLGSDDRDELYTLQNQPCIYNAYEPMKSYTTGDIDHFYLKLRIAKRNGIFYESQSVTIERGGKRPVPEGTTRYACFSSDMIVREPVTDSQYRFRMYGRYQLTVSADATSEDVSALLPDTLPVEIQLIHGRDFKVNGVVDCPVTWKPLTLPQLLAGEAITILDAAEEIIVPAGTQLSTPLGIFELDEPLRVDAPPLTDEVRLVLNVSPEDRTLDGVLKQAPDGLTVALQQKPTGAASIEAYVLTEGESKWTEIPGRSLLKQMNAQHATENSGFALVLYNDEEPFCSYLEAKKAGTDPTPFFVGLKIEGGIYDGRQLILAWPDIYEELPDLPRVGRSEGNEGNAGADNKDDSTESGQRPNLPQTPNADQGGQQPAPQTPPADDSQVRQPVTPPIADNRGQKQPLQAEIPDTPETIDTPETAGVVSEKPVEHSAGETFPDPQETEQRPNLSHTMPDTTDASALNQENGLTLEPLVAQAAVRIKEKENVSDTSVSKTVLEPVPVTEQDSRAPLLAVTATASTVAAGGCIGAAVFKSAGHGLFQQMAGTIRKLFHIK